MKKRCETNLLATIRKNHKQKRKNYLLYNTYYSNIHTWTDNAPAAKSDKQGQKEKIMKALYKKYASLARKHQRAFAQLQASGYFSHPDVGPLPETQQTAFAAEQTSYAEDKAFAATLDKWTLVKIGLAFCGSRGYIRPINQAVIEYREKREKQRVADEWLKQFIL